MELMATKTTQEYANYQYRRAEAVARIKTARKAYDAGGEYFSPAWQRLQMAKARYNAMTRKPM